MRKSILTGTLVALVGFGLAGCGGDSLPAATAELEKKDAKDLIGTTDSMLYAKGSGEILEYFGDANFSKLSVALGKMEDGSSQDFIGEDYVYLPIVGKHLPNDDSGSGYWTVEYSKGKDTDALKNKGDVAFTETNKNFMCCKDGWKSNGKSSVSVKWSIDYKKYSLERTSKGNDVVFEKGDYKIVSTWEYSKKNNKERKDDKKTSVKETSSTMDAVLTKKDTKIAEIKQLKRYHKKSVDDTGKSYEENIDGAIYGKRYGGWVVFKTIETIKGHKCDLAGEIQVQGKDNTVSYALKDKKYTIKFNDEVVESGSQCGGEAAE